MIKDRVIQVLEYKCIPKESFYTKIGITSANFRGKAKNTPLNSTTIENILSVIPDINLAWLLTGQGAMFSTEHTNTTEERLLDLLKEKDAKIEELSRLVGRLESRVEFLQKKATSPNDEVAEN